MKTNVGRGPLLCLAICEAVMHTYMHVIMFHTEACSDPCQTFNTELFAKIVDASIHLLLM